MKTNTITSDQLLRAGGFALLAGSVASIAYVVLRSVATAGMDPVLAAKAAFWVPLNALGVVGGMLVLLGLPALFSRMIDSDSRTGAIGVALLAASWAFHGWFLSLYGLLVLPWLADRTPYLVAPGSPLPPAFVVTFAVELLGWIVGAVLAAIPFIRHRAGPGWVGYVLIASAVAALAGNLVIAPSGPASNLGLNLLSNSGPMLLLVALGYLGLRTVGARGAD